MSRHRPTQTASFLQCVWRAVCFCALCAPAPSAWWMHCIWTPCLPPHTPPHPNDTILLESCLHHAPVWTPFKHTETATHTHTHLHSPSHMLNTLIALPLVRHYQLYCVLSSPPVYQQSVLLVSSVHLSFLSMDHLAVSPRGVSPLTSNISQRPAIVSVELFKVHVPSILSSVAHINGKSSRQQHGCQIYPRVLHWSLLALLSEWLWLT